MAELTLAFVILAGIVLALWVRRLDRQVRNLAEFVIVASAILRRHENQIYGDEITAKTRIH